MKNIRFCVVVLLGVFISTFACAQQKDSANRRTPIRNNNIFKFAMGAVTRSNPDTAGPADVLQHKAETPFLPFDGKGIRSVTVVRFGFEKTFQDTSRGIKYFGTEILNHLHRNSREWVIRNNLFFKAKEPLDAYLLADNERYLRSLEFIQDARIIVNPVRDQPDSVDVFVVSKDLFSITAELGELSPNKFKGKLSDANVLGMGQKIQFSTLWDKSRWPAMGYDVQYSKTNIGGTFINGSLGYTSIGHAVADGAQSEHGWFVGFDRPLPYASAKFAGALRVSRYESSNNYSKPDSEYYSYRYHNYDVWAGHNIAAKNFLRNSLLENRYFLSLRYFNFDLKEAPYQFKDTFNFIFNSRQAVLGQFTFFRQNFYKTNYILDFGTTEDAPYGYNVAVVAGWYKQRNLARQYVGVDANRYIVTQGQGRLIQYYLRVGGFFNRGDIEDAAVLLGSSFYSRLFVYRHLKIRQYFNLNYTRQFNRVSMFPLFINNNDFGLQNFSIGEIMGGQRISLQSETTFFLQPKLLGFKFAPFAFANAVLLTPEQKYFSKSGLYYGLGGGLRTRNINLVFGTLELRCIYFPRNEDRGDKFKIGINTNIRFRYNSNYVKAPDIIQVNSDPDNNIN